MNTFLAKNIFMSEHLPNMAISFLKKNSLLKFIKERSPVEFKSSVQHVNLQI
jgi:hypothetical protein